jgi:pimeloyl-ACP methyl ester carboxylesterase
MTPRRSLALSAGLLTAFAVPSAAQMAAPYNVPYVPTRDIAWSACTADDASPDFFPLLGDRLRCGTVGVPRDHHRPAEGNITLRVVRVAAADATKRQGALFVNPGGPGGDAGTFAVTLAAIWMHAKPGDPVHGEKKRMADAFDLIAVIPRGMPGSTPLDCVGEFPVIRAVLLDRTAANTARFDLLQRRMADACRADPLHPYITTEQTVYDLDLVRRALGETTFNFFGVSYGTWLGAWYGATYPDKVGRMLFDSTMDFTATMEDNFLLSGKAEQERFDRLVAKPAIAAPATYGLGTSEADVRGAMTRLPYRVRFAWTGEFRSPESLKAAQAMADWLQEAPGLTRKAMAARIASAAFHPMAYVNLRIRDEARRMLYAVYGPTQMGLPSSLAPASAMMVAVPCNDTPGIRDAGIWQQTIARYAADYPAAHSADLLNPCVFWTGPNAVRPPIARLARAGRILIVASEFDTLTPIAGALNMINALPAASALVLRGHDRHGVFTLTDEACIERTGARFLLDARVPSEQLTECQVDSSARTDAGQPTVDRFTEAPKVQRWRDRLAEGLARDGRMAMRGARP